MTGIERIAQERQHQVDKGYDAVNDDQYTDGELAAVAADVALQAADCVESYEFEPEDAVPEWSNDVFAKHHHDPIKMLAVAGALIAAEIDRLHRKAEKEA